MVRRGFTLAELMVGIIVAGLVGTALMGMLLTEAKATSNRDAWRNARGVSRGTLNLLESELAMVETSGGIETVNSGQDLTLRVPFAMGILCGYAAGVSTLSLLPTDSSLYFASGYSGFAWRSGLTYNYVLNTTAINNSAATAPCTAQNITTLPAPGAVAANAGRIVAVTGNIASAPPIATAYILFRRIRYEFKASVLVPGQIGLWRTLVTTGTTQEIAAPFDTTSRFRFFVKDSTTAQNAVPGTLSDIRGLEIQLDGASEQTPRGGTRPKIFRTTTAIFFFNRPD
jgi:prepilin-type N-terminal cleavage/methylation domain-containing protein